MCQCSSLAVLILMQILIIGVVQEQPKGSGKPYDRGPMRIEQKSLTEGLADVLRAARKPGGIARIHKRGSVERKLTTLVNDPVRIAAALDTLISTEPEYKWVLENGVVNILPKKELPSLLSVQVRIFEAKNTASMHDLVAKLLASPEVKKAQVEFHLEANPLRFGFDRLNHPSTESTEEKRTLDVQCRNCTVREVLNRIVRAHGFAVWAYDEYELQETKRFQIGIVSQ